MYAEVLPYRGLAIQYMCTNSGDYSSSRFPFRARTDTHSRTKSQMPIMPLITTAHPSAIAGVRNYHQLVSECVHVPKRIRLELSIPNFSAWQSLGMHWLRGQKVKGQGHRYLHDCL